MSNKIQKIFSRFLFFALMSISIVSPLSFVQAQVENINVNDSKFKLMFCDGPAGLNDPKNFANDSTWVQDKNFVPCDFFGFMKQIQRLISVMIVAGVLAAIAGFTYAGFLYISGVPGKITQAHEIFKKVGLGFVLMLSAWAIVYQILSWLTDNAAIKGLLK